MAESNRTATITADRSFAEVMVRFSYDPDVVDSIKSLPRFARRWDPAAKAWRVDAAHHTAVLLILTRAGYKVLDKAGKAPRSVTTSPVEAYRAALDACPEHLRKALYRAMLGVLHPDRGGTNDAVRELIEAGGDGT